MRAKMCPAVLLPAVVSSRLDVSGPCKNSNVTPSHAEMNTNCQQFFEGNSAISGGRGVTVAKGVSLFVRKHCEVCHMTPEHP